MSWIARKLKGDEILIKAMEGPSVQTTLHQKGFIDAVTGLRHRYDSLSDNEVKILLGFVGSKTSAEVDESLFPSVAILQKHSRHWSGEMNQVLDRIMNVIWDSCQDGTFELLTPGKWRQYLRSDNRHGHEPSFIPKPQDWQEAQERLRNTYSVVWDKAAVADIQIPELFSPIVHRS